MLAVWEMLCLPCSVRGYGFALPASAMSRCSFYLPWFLLLPKISSLWLCQQKTQIMALKPASLQNWVLGTNQTGFWYAASSFMNSFQQPWRLLSGIDSPAKKSVNPSMEYFNWWSLWCQSVVLYGKMSCFFPLLWGNEELRFFLVWSWTKRKLTHFLQNGQHSLSLESTSGYSGIASWMWTEMR